MATSYIKLVNGIEVEMTAEEKAARDTEVATFEDTRHNRAIARLRVERNKLLAETDFYALADTATPMSEAMTTYRQELRDVTNGLTSENYYTAQHELDFVFPTKP